MWWQVNTMKKQTISSTALRTDIESLRHMTVGQLKAKYSEVFGEDSRSNHKQFLFRRIAWRIQANEPASAPWRLRTTPTFASEHLKIS
jgi:hypothetical protein